MHSDTDALIDDLSLWVGEYVYKIAALHDMTDLFETILAKVNKNQFYVSGFLKAHADDSIR